MPPAELVLPVVAIALYLFDAVVLLHDDERLVEKRGRRWAVARPSDVVWLRRRVQLPNPLRPHEPAFVVPLGGDAGGGIEPETFLRALRPLRPLVVLLLALLLALPVASLRYGAGLALLAVMAAYALVLLCAVAVLWWQRRRLGLAPRAAAALTADVLLCAPFGVNLVRRVCQRRVTGDAARAVALHVLGDDRAALVGEAGE